MTPKSLLLIHGAGSGPWVFDGWGESFPGLHIAVPDLHEGLDVGRASMDDYTARVVAEGRLLGKPLAVCGWSMGGLVAMMAASKLGPEWLILVEASAPREVQGFNEQIEPCPGVFDSERVYGAFPSGVRSRPESQYARAERKRGISVAALPERTLVISGREYPDERGRQLAAFYGAHLREFPTLSHWELVRAISVRDEIRRFLAAGRPVPK